MPRMQEFVLKTLCKIDKLNEPFNDLLKLATRDCLERREESKAREIVLKIRLTPDPNNQDDVIMVASVKGKCPDRLVQAYRMTTSSKGDLRFRPNSPMDPQINFLDDDAE